MKPLIHQDVTAAARRLLCYPRAERWERMVAMIDVADRVHQGKSSAHAFGGRRGDGTLGSAARERPLGQEPSCEDGEYAHALATAYAAVSAYLDRRGMSDFS